MEALFLRIVNLSITASWLVLAVVVLRLVFRKAPKGMICMLWGLIALRLICPISVNSAFSLIPSAEPIPQDFIGTATPQIQSGITAVDNVVNPILTSTLTPAVGASVNPAQVWTFILSSIWIIGAAVLLLYALISYLFLKRCLSTATVFRKTMKQSDQIHSPFVLGLFHPVIYLPYKIAGTDLEYVIAHEQAHISRKDHWWKAIGYVILSVYWFNPLLWAAYILFGRDVERACDEKVIRDMGKEERRAYSAALLHCSIHRRRMPACPLAFGEIGVKERVKAVMYYQKPAFWIVLAAAAACGVAAVCFLTNPAEKRETLTWARELSAEEVAAADLVVFSQTTEKPYKNLSGDEISAMTALVNQSRGSYVAEPEDLDGVGIFFYLTMKDGSVHKIGNIGNVYLYIDGDYYEAEYEWLSSWDDQFGEGSGPLPEGYLEGIPEQRTEAETAEQEKEEEPEHNLLPNGQQDISATLFSEMPAVYWFLSGAGGWSTVLYLAEDGSFSGLYEDADMGVVWRCEFTGRFSAPVKVNDYTYSVHVEALDYPDPGDEFYEGERKVITAEPYGLDHVDEVLIYLPGYPVSELSEEAYQWVIASGEEFWVPENRPDTLPFYAINNVNEQMVFTAMPEKYLEGN